MMRPIETIKADLEYATALNEKNWVAVRNSSRPDIDRVFAVSSAKLREVLDAELKDALQVQRCEETRSGDR